MGSCVYNRFEAEAQNGDVDHNGSGTARKFSSRFLDYININDNPFTALKSSIGQIFHKRKVFIWWKATCTNLYFERTILSIVSFPSMVPVGYQAGFEVGC